MSTAIVQGSIGAISQQTGKSLAETFISADVIVIIDTSGSMGAEDSRGGKSRYDIACEELKILQASLPGKIAVVNFSGSVQFEPGGHPMFLSGGTNLAKALAFVRIADIKGMRFILISDGSPDDEGAALHEARQFQNHIDVIYVGPEDRPYGRDFLQRLAKLTGGKSVTADCAKQLSAGVMQLLEAGI
jgi:hypothetical protein